MADPMTWIAVSAVTAAVAGGASTAYSIHQGNKQEKAAKTQMQMAQIEQAEQKKEAEKQRRELVDQQRENMALGQRFTTSTREKTPKDSGLRGKLTEDILG